MVDDVTEQGDGRDELLVADPRQGRCRLGRRLDEHDVGLQLVERLHDRARRTGTVVPDAEQVHRHVRAPSVQRAAGVVEVVPAVAVAHDRLEVLAPGHRIVHRIANDRADDAGRDVVGPQRAVAEVGGQRQPVGDDRDRLGRRQRAARHLEARCAVGR